MDLCVGYGSALCAPVLYCLLKCGLELFVLYGELMSGQVVWGELMYCMELMVRFCKVLWRMVWRGFVL